MSALSKRAEARKLIAGRTRIISKLEKPAAIERLDEIVEVDGALGLQRELVEREHHVRDQVEIVTLLAGVVFPSPLARSHDLGVRISELHTWLGDAIVWIAGAHALAAIYHHAILKDTTLVSMLPAGIARRLPGRN